MSQNERAQEPRASAAWGWFTCLLSDDTPAAYTTRFIAYPFRNFKESFDRHRARCNAPHSADLDQLFAEGSSVDRPVWIDNLLASFLQDELADSALAEEVAHHSVIAGTSLAARVDACCTLRRLHYIAMAGKLREEKWPRPMLLRQLRLSWHIHVLFRAAFPIVEGFHHGVQCCVDEHVNPIQYLNRVQNDYGEETAAVASDISHYFATLREQGHKDPTHELGLLVRRSLDLPQSMLRATLTARDLHRRLQSLLDTHQLRSAKNSLQGSPSSIPPMDDAETSNRFMMALPVIILQLILNPFWTAPPLWRLFLCKVLFNRNLLKAAFSLLKRRSIPLTEQPMAERQVCLPGLRLYDTSGRQISFDTKALAAGSPAAFHVSLEEELDAEGWYACHRMIVSMHVLTRYLFAAHEGHHDRHQAALLAAWLPSLASHQTEVDSMRELLAKQAEIGVRAAAECGFQSSNAKPIVSWWIAATKTVTGRIRSLPSQAGDEVTRWLDAQFMHGL